MTNIGINNAVIWSTLVVIVSGLRYKCYKDICDSSWQFCNDLEERCSTCLSEHCLPDVAEKIFNQCEQTCQKTHSTTSTVTTTVTAVTSPLTSTSEVFNIDRVLLVSLIILVISLTIIVVIGFCTIYKKISKTEKNDVEVGYSTGTVTHIAEARGEVEKRPLLDTRPPSDSSLHDNKMADMHALAQATGQGPVQVEQASAPPSYSTDVPQALGSPVEQPSSDQDNLLSMKLGKTDFLKDEFQSQTESVTRPKCT